MPWRNLSLISALTSSHTVREALENGYTVRATARSAAKGDYIRNLFPQYKDNIEIALVPDMQKDGAYDEAVKGVVAVLHIASPVELEDDDREVSAMSEEATKGVTGLLDSINKNAPTVKRVVQISSIVSIGMPTGGDVDETSKLHGKAETDLTVWNEEGLEIGKKLGRKAPGFIKYIVSKVDAERAFWKEIKNAKNYDGVSLLPGLIFGPPTAYNDTGAVIGSFSLAVAPLTPGATDETLETESYNIVDVRDIATAIVRSLKVEEAGGERILLAAHPFFGVDIAQIGAKLYPDAGINAGSPEMAKKVHQKQRIFNHSKADKILNMKWYPAEETLTEAVNVIVPSLIKQSA